MVTPTSGGICGGIDGRCKARAFRAVETRRESAVGSRVYGYACSPRCEADGWAVVEEWHQREERAGIRQ